MPGYSFTDEVRAVLMKSRNEAAALGHEYVGTEHLLLALVHDPDGTAATVLSGLGAPPEAVAELVMRTVSPGHAPDRRQEPPYTFRSKKVLELAMMAARNLHHDHVGAGHLLLGLLREEMGIGSQVLTQFGVTPERVQAGLGWESGASATLPQRGNERAGAGQSPRWEGVEGIKADVRNLLTAQEAYRMKHGHYASSLKAILEAWPGHTFHAPHVEVRGDATGCMVRAWDDALKPGPSRCTCHVGAMAAALGVESGRLVTD